MAPVNVLLSGLHTSLCFHMGDTSTPLRAETVMAALSASTGLPPYSFYLRQQSGLLNPDDLVAMPGQHTTFLTVCLRRALPGGKGGFGAMLKGSAARKKTTNFDACRDLEGRRIRHVRDEIAVRQFANQQSQQVQEHTDKPKKRPRDAAVLLDEEGKTVDVEQVNHDMHRIGRGVQDAVVDAVQQAMRRKRRKKPTRTTTSQKRDLCMVDMKPIHQSTHSLDEPIKQVEECTNVVNG